MTQTEAESFLINHFQFVMPQQPNAKAVFGPVFLEKTSRTTETHAKQKTLGWHRDAGVVPLPAFAPKSLCQPFINALFGMR